MKTKFPFSLSILVILILLAVSFGIYKLYISRAAVIWDESVYLLLIYRIYASVKSGNWAEFWKITQNQFAYPPLQSWVLGMPLSVFGFSITAARMLSSIEKWTLFRLKSGQ